MQNGFYIYEIFLCLFPMFDVQIKTLIFLGNCTAASLTWPHQLLLILGRKFILTFLLHGTGRTLPNRISSVCLNRPVQFFFFFGKYFTLKNLIRTVLLLYLILFHVIGTENSPALLEHSGRANNVDKFI